MSGAPINTFLAAATSAFLFLAPFAGSAGARATALILASIVLAASWRTHVAPFIRQVPLGPAVAFGAWALLALASMAWSVDRRYTLGELRAELFYAALTLFVFFLAAQRPGRWPLWCKALLAGTLAVFVLHLAQRLFGFSLTRHTVFEQRGPWSTHLVLVAPLVLALGWRAPWGGGRSVRFGALALAVLLYAAWETDNRIVWVALAVQFLVAASLRAAWAAANGGAAAWRRLTVAAALVATVALAVSIADRTALHFAGAGANADSLERDVRPRIWGAAWEKFRQAPLLGHGFGREILAADFIPHTPRVLNHPQIRHGHNVFVDMALELGIVGLAAFVALLALIGREYLRCLRRADLAPLGVLGLMVLSGFLVKCLTDDFLHRHNALVFWALNATLLGLARSAPGEE